MKYSLGSFKLLSNVRVSILIALATFLFAAATPSYGQTRVLRITSTSVEKTKQFTVDIQLDSLGNENSAGFSVIFDPTLLNFVSSAPGSDLGNGTLFPNVSQAGNGRVGFLLGKAPGEKFAAGTRQLAILTFTALGTGTATSAEIGFGDLPIPREMVDDKVNLLEVTYLSGTVALYGKSTTASAASYSTTAFAPQSIVAVFGTNLATGELGASTVPLPTTLLGTTIKVKDSANVERPASLFFVSPNQCNYQIPDGTATGTATLRITSGDGKISVGTVTIVNVAPGIFSANSDGRGVAAAQIYRIRGVSQTIEEVAVYGPDVFIPKPIDLGPPEDTLVLVLYATGLRLNTGVSGVTATVGGTSVPVGYANLAPGFVGLDQINIGALPRSLAGRGLVNVVVTVDGIVANTVTIEFK